MNVKIETRSAVCGLMAGVIVTLAIGAATTSNPPGRFQIAGAANYFMVLDTETGKVWGGNFHQSGQFSQAVEFKSCPQSSGDFFQPKVN